MKMKTIKYNDIDFYYLLDNTIIGNKIVVQTHIYCKYIYKFITPKFLCFGGKEKEVELFDILHIIDFSIESEEYEKEQIRKEMEIVWKEYLNWKERHRRKQEIERGEII